MPPPLSSLCGRRSASRRRADRNVAVVYHGQYVSTLTAAAAWRANTVVSKAVWSGDLDLWPFDRESGVRVSSVPTLVFLGLCSRLRPDVRNRCQTSDRQTDRQTDRRQTASSLYAAVYQGRGIIFPSTVVHPRWLGSGSEINNITSTTNQAGQCKPAGYSHTHTYVSDVNYCLK